MAEISEAQDSDSSKPADNASKAPPQPEPEPEFDTKSMRKTKPGLKRLFLTLSVLFSFLLGFPFLWKSVEIYRSPLPFREIDSLSTQLRSEHLLFPLHFHVLYVLVKVFVNGGREEGSIQNEFMPVGADGRIVLSFNLLNADPRDWVYDWDFQKIDDNLLAPMIEALGPVANISVESQVLYHTPKASFSYWDQKLESYVFSTKDLPFFVNSNEWHLDTSIAAGGRSKILQLVVYVPSAKECPLLLQLPNGEISKTNGFISPMWGGVIVWNPEGCLKDDNKPTARHTIPMQDLENMFEVFTGQFRQLFGFKSVNVYTGASGVWNLLPSERGFTEWELDVLSWQHTCFNLHSCATTLGSLSRLVQSLPRMIIMDEIGKQVKFSLEAAKLAQSNASSGVYESSAASSRQARALAEDAFFHPSIMSVSYYSFEHCFAVYSPFFLPVSMHVVLAALRELKRYKQEKAKYLAWKAKARTAS
ncbi:hypothetical protein PTKIN_Ptkin15bG0137900 [Pterospermum kingtungense]